MTRYDALTAPHDAFMCETCGGIHFDTKGCHGGGYRVVIEPCPVPHVNDSRYKTFHTCTSGDHHWGRGDHVRIVGRRVSDEHYRRVMAHV